MVLKLYPKYEKTVICRRLRQSGSQLKQHLDSSSSYGAGFVLASVESIKEHLTPQYTTDYTRQRVNLNVVC